MHAAAVKKACQPTHSPRREVFTPFTGANTALYTAASWPDGIERPAQLHAPVAAYAPVGLYASRRSRSESTGSVMLPAVSVPIEKPTSPAAVAEPGPEDEPAASRCGFQGVRVRPG